MYSYKKVLTMIKFISSIVWYVQINKIGILKERMLFLNSSLNHQMGIKSHSK